MLRSKRTTAVCNNVSGWVGGEGDACMHSAYVGHVHIYCARHGCVADYVTGFGGKYGVQKDRQDKAAVGWEHKAELSKHESQKGTVFLGFSFSCGR